MDQLIRTLMALTGMSQTELAEELGVDRSAVSLWSNGKRTMNSETFVNLVKIVGEETSPGEIINLIISTEI